MPALQDLARSLAISSFGNSGPALSFSTSPHSHCDHQYPSHTASRRELPPRFRSPSIIELGGIA